MNNIIARKVTITANYAALSSDTDDIGTITITSPASNSGNINIQGDAGGDTPIVPGEWHKFENVRLSDIKVKGTADDILTIIGNTCK